MINEVRSIPNVVIELVLSEVNFLINFFSAISTITLFHNPYTYNTQGISAPTLSDIFSNISPNTTPISNLFSYINKEFQLMSTELTVTGINLSLTDLLESFYLTMTHFTSTVVNLLGPVSLSLHWSNLVSLFS